MKIFVPGSMAGEHFRQPVQAVRTEREDLPLWKPACPAHREKRQILHDLGIPSKI
ncbi:MAG: hypothetical protein K6E36_06410 [Oscillospiraceae bacterium]|nr:hypothetical protein [Oscillospiraceae bacterium]